MNLRFFSDSMRLPNALLLSAALTACAPLLQAQDPNVYEGENTDHYAAVRLLEGAATIRKFETEEPLSRGVPVTDGDVVESHGRGVLQLADGSRIAFGPNTRFQVAALFREQDQPRQVLLRLDHGRLRMALGREDSCQMRVDTPSGGALLVNGAQASLEVESNGTARLNVHSSRVSFSNERGQVSLQAGERLTVASAQDRLNQVQDFNTYGGDAFETWAERQLAVRRGPGWDKMPPELRYYSDDLDANGEWIWVEPYRSWCWRPLGVSADWRPYWRGRWGAYPGGMTWISDEPWGYVTYHHGRWGWEVGLGWYWIPGIYYAPAWVAWQSADIYFGWAPLGYHNHPVAWNYGPWRGDYCWNVVEINYIHTSRLHHHTYYDQRVSHHFNSKPYPHGNRTLASPWRQTPLIVSPKEFKNPSQMQRVSRDSELVQFRHQVYEAQIGGGRHRKPPMVSGATGTQDPNRSPSRPVSNATWRTPSSQSQTPHPGYHKSTSNLPPEMPPQGSDRATPRPYGRPAAQGSRATLPPPPPGSSLTNPPFYPSQASSPRSDHSKPTSHGRPLSPSSSPSIPPFNPDPSTAPPPSNQGRPPSSPGNRHSTPFPSTQTGPTSNAPPPPYIPPTSKKRPLGRP
jgi:hypothetical protein